MDVYFSAGVTEASVINNAFEKCILKHISLTLLRENIVNTSYYIYLPNSSFMISWFTCHSHKHMNVFLNSKRAWLRSKGNIDIIKLRIVWTTTKNFLTIHWKKIFIYWPCIYSIYACICCVCIHSLHIEILQNSIETTLLM